MNKLIYMLSVVLLSWGMTGCKKEAKLTPTTKPEDVYSEHTLPQGNHPYDADIQQLYDKYKTLFLYKYVPHDLYFNVDQDLGGTYDSVAGKVTKPGYFDVPADQAYVGQQLDLLKQLWLSYYPDSLLKKGLPPKVYLVDSFYFAYSGPGKPLDNWPTMTDVFSGTDYILFAWGGARILDITAADKYALKGQMNTAFLGFARKQGAVKVTPAFAAVTDYSILNWSNQYEQGVLYIDQFGNTPEKDWDSYVTAMVSNSYDVLTSPGNILDPDVDTRGAIKKRYDIVIDYFKTTFGVDLQAIGNAGL